MILMIMLSHCRKLKIKCIWHSVLNWKQEEREILSVSIYVSIAMFVKENADFSFYFSRIRFSCIVHIQNMIFTTAKKHNRSLHGIQNSQLYSRVIDEDLCVAVSWALMSLTQLPIGIWFHLYIHLISHCPQIYDIILLFSLFSMIMINNHMNAIPHCMLNTAHTYTHRKEKMSYIILI